MPDVDLIVNCYERTYKRVLQPGFFDRIEQQNRFRFAARYALVNNVDDPSEAATRADGLVSADEITGWAYVTDQLERALNVTGLSRRALRRRPYFLDYGLAMTVTGESSWLLGWDAEVSLTEPRDWITPAVNLMTRRPDVFSASPNWPRRGTPEGSLPEETIERDGDWWLNWSFSDQVFLVRRAEVAAPIYRRFAPAALTRHSAHPRTFEARIEAYQRAARRPRATFAALRYDHNDMSETVAVRVGETAAEKLRHALLYHGNRVLRRISVQQPRWRVP